MTDAELAAFLRIPVQAVARLAPEHRASFERMAKIIADLNLEIGPAAGSKFCGMRRTDGPAGRRPDSGRPGSLH